MIILYCDERPDTPLTSLPKLVGPGYLSFPPQCPHDGEFVLVPADHSREYPRVARSLHHWPGTKGEPPPPPPPPGPTLEHKITTSTRNIMEQDILNGASRLYGRSGQDPDSWSVRLEEFLVQGNRGSNVYGYANPAAAPDSPCGGQFVLNWNTLNVPEEQWNPAVFITSHPVYGSYDISAENELYPLLIGSMIFSKSNVDARISCFYIDENGPKGPLRYIDMP